MALRQRLRLAAGLLFFVTALPVCVVLLLRPRVHEPRADEVRSWETSVPHLAQTLAVLPGPRSVEDPAAMALTEELVAGALTGAGFSVHREEVRHAQGTLHRHAPVHNVLTPVPAKGDFWLVAAHLDTIPGSPGADDDASGIAVLLEMARLVGGSTPPPPVVFALFNEEETGLLGSRQFVGDGASSWGDRLRGALVMDSVGFYDAARDTQQAPSPLGPFTPSVADFLSILTVADSSMLVGRFISARNAAAPALRLVSFAPPRPMAERVPDLWRSDHAPFWAAGLPALFLTDTANFRNPRYHTPDDVRASLDLPRLAQLSHVMAAFVREP
jgi:hypothetical protein